MEEQKKVNKTENSTTCREEEDNGRIERKRVRGGAGGGSVAGIRENIETDQKNEQ